MTNLEKNASKFFTPAGLSIYSPQFLEILKRIQDPLHEGLHLLYSNFRTLEGIGILKMVLEANNMAEFKIKKVGNKWEWEDSEDGYNSMIADDEQPYEITNTSPVSRVPSDLEQDTKAFGGRR